MGADALADRIGQPAIKGRELLSLHRRTFPCFWRWSNAAVDEAMLHGSLRATFGWTVHVGGAINPRSLRNFPMQANGAEMLRLAICFATEAGVSVCAPVHDALLIEAPTSELAAAVNVTRSAMAKASQLVLDGFELDTDVKRFAHPSRYEDERGARMWETVIRLARCQEKAKGGAVA